MTNTTRPSQGSAAQQYLDDLLRKVPPEAILAELDAALAAKPTPQELAGGSDDALGWFGRVQAALRAWDSVRASSVLSTVDMELHGSLGGTPQRAHRRLITLVNEARADLVLKAGRASTVAAKGHVHDYFDGLRKIIERATTDLYFADPFLDADFIARYMPFVPQGVQVRLLARKHLKTLLPAVDMFVAQHGTKIQVRSLGEHDRFVFVDGKECFQSGGTFHQGAVAAGTAIVPVIDAADAIRTLYEAHWKNAKVERN